MVISVSRAADDGLSRQRWDFTASTDYRGEVLLCLVTYRVERRKTARGRFGGGLPADGWTSTDERSYASGLPRPTLADIPRDVWEEAAMKVRWRYFIGWTNDEHEVRP